MSVQCSWYDKLIILVHDVINLYDIKETPGQILKWLKQSRDHQFSTYAKFSEKKFLLPVTHTYIFGSGGKKC